MPESALALLLGSEVEYKFYAGVMVLDGGKVKVSVKRWRELMAIKVLRKGVEGALERCFREPGREVGERERKWLDFWVGMEKALEG